MNINYQKAMEFYMDLWLSERYERYECEGGYKTYSEWLAAQGLLKEEDAKHE